MSSEHEDAIQQISQPLIELFGDVHQPTECNCIAEVAEQVADWHLAQLQAAKAEAEQDMQISNMEWRIEQWRRARKYMLNDTWQPMFDELCAEMDRLKATPKEDKETE